MTNHLLPLRFAETEHIPSWVYRRCKFPIRTPKNRKVGGNYYNFNGTLDNLDCQGTVDFLAVNDLFPLHPFKLCVGGITDQADPTLERPLILISHLANVRADFKKDVVPYALSIQLARYSTTLEIVPPSTSLVGSSGTSAPMIHMICTTGSVNWLGWRCSRGANKILYLVVRVEANES